MKFFAFISLFLAFSLGVTVELGLHQQTPPPKVVPAFLKNYHQKVKDQFKRPENANVLFSFITGNRNGISPYTKKAFKKTNLSFLLSPSGIHFGSVLLFFTFFLKKIKNKWLKRGGKCLAYLSAFMAPGLLSIHRLSILRLLLQFNFISRMKLSLEWIFIITFIVAFLMGHYQKSPLGFLMSFAFLGTFFSLRDHSKFILILGLFSTQLIIALFLGDKVSLFSIPVGLFGSFIFAGLFPLLLIFLATFWFIPFNWAEPLIRAFIVCVQFAAKALQGSFTSSSIFLILGIWVLLLMTSSKRKCLLLLILFFLHSNSAMSPSIFR